MKQFRVALGLKVELFASEPILANPVSFTFDEKGRIFVVESHRQRNSVLDIRHHPEWLDADLSFHRVEDREGFLKKVLTRENQIVLKSKLSDLNRDGVIDYRDLEVESERIRLLEDRDGDGKADYATTFAEGFKTLVSGGAGGIWARSNQVWFGCIPDLWALRDTNGDGQADIRQSLLSGFGVHISSGGRDLHGLRFGPDGKLYLAIGDRGFSVRTGPRTIALPDSGAVLRCNPDGSELEIVATGLRNPRALAFDQFGNLWAGDSSGDDGETGRWVYVIEGSESGWQIGWQHLPKLGAWNEEKLWEMAGANPAAYVLPPVGHVGRSPAGATFYPGTGLPVSYDHHFLMCDLPGSVISFALRPKGASYEVIDPREFLGGLYPVDVQFGPEGMAYVADLGEGLKNEAQGRLFRIFDPNLVRDSAVRETKRLLAEGFEKRSPRELARLLEHRDQRVRLEAQFALTEKKAEATNRLAAAAAKNDHPLARLHAIWALANMSRDLPSALSWILPLLGDTDPEVRAQSAKVLGSARLEESYESLIRLLQDPHPRVRFFAALGVGKMGHQEATEPIFQMLRENAGDDPYLRHAGVMALVWLNDINALVGAAKDGSARVRMGTLLAMRRLNRPEVAMFLYDPEPSLVLESARAIYDLPIASAYSQLATLISKDGLSLSVMRRVLYASYRLGNLENALGLAEFAAHPTRPEALRSEALQLLSQWSKPLPLDPVLGLFRPLGSRDSRGANLALRSELPKILRTGTDVLRIAAIRTAIQAEMSQIAPAAFQLFSDRKNSLELRLEALRALSHFKDSRLLEAMSVGLGDAHEALRKEAGQLLAKLKPNEAIGQVAAALEKGTVGEKQSALNTLASLENPIADQVIVPWLDLLQRDQVPNELKLDVLEAAARRSAPSVRAKLQEYEAARSSSDPLARFRECLFGGEAQAGRAIFYERVETGCLRCHKIGGSGGDTGPELSGIGSRMNREQILESMVRPNKEIAVGYENVIVTLNSGTTYAGRWKNETERELLLISPDIGLIVLSKNQIQKRQVGPSKMPTDFGNLLLKRELRNLVEFLSTLK